MRSTLYSPINQKLRQLMNEARRKAGMTQAELAKATGRTQAYISKFEHGHLRLDVEDFLSFCSALKLEPKSIISELNTLPSK